MAFLDADKVSDIQARLSGGAPPSAPPSMPSSDPPPSSPPSEQSQSQSEAAPSSTPPSQSVESSEATPSPSSTPDVNKGETTSTSEGAAPRASAEGSKQKPGGSDTGQRVPYSRFKNVLDARNRFKQETARYRQNVTSQAAQIASLEKQIANISARPAYTPPAAMPQPAAAEPKTDTSWLDDILGTDEKAAPAAVSAEPPEWFTNAQSQWQEQQKGVQERMYQYEVNNAQRELEGEINTVRRRYPDFRAQDLAQAVINDPSINLMEAAEQFMTYKASIEERAIDKYLRENPHLTREQAEGVVQEAMSEPAPEPPPRTEGARSSTSAGMMVADSDRPKNLKDASSALRSFMQTSNPFRR